MSELSLPNLMSGLVNTGIQQGGLEADAPKAMSEKAQKLLLLFCGEEDKELLLENYFVIEPESSEAQRISKDYPLARKEAVCVLREGLEEEARLALDEAYGRAAYGFLLYMQEAGASGELTELAAQAAAQGGAGRPSAGKPREPGSIPNIFDFPIFDPDAVSPGQTEGPAGPSGNTGTTSDSNLDQYLQQGGGNTGYYTASDGTLVPYSPPATSSTSDLHLAPQVGDMIGTGEPMLGNMAAVAVPEPAMPETAPRDETFGGFGEGAQGYEGNEEGIDPHGEDSPMIPEKKPEYNEEEPAPQRPQASLDLTEAGGLGNFSAERLYQLLPLLELAPKESIGRAVSLAAESPEGMAGQVGVQLKRIFYTELGIDLDPVQSAYIWHKGLQMLGVALLGAIAAVLVGLIASRVSTAVAKRLRHDLFTKVMAMNGPELDGFSTASLITRTTNDVQQVGMLVMMGLRMVCYAPIMGIGGIVMAVDKSVSMSWLVAAAVVVMLGLVIIALSLALPRFKALQALLDKLGRITREHLSGMMVVRAFGNQRFEEERFREVNREFTATNRFVQRVMAGMMPAMMLIMNLSTLVILWAGGHAIAESALQIGDMMAFIQYAMQIIASFLMIAMMFVMLPRASVSAARIGEVLDRAPEIEDPVSAAGSREAKGVISFEDVSFRYNDAESYVLEHISFTARPGETTAIIGATGAGKSTLINLIPRFYDVTEGKITLDGIDIQSYKQKDLRALIGYVPQKALLFSGSIAENLRYGREDAGEEDLREALKTAQAEDFVAGMEKGLGAYVAQGGTNVSGGQRQRLSMARALVRKAPVYIFDDSFSALDFKTEAALRRALVPYTREAAVLIVAQRVSTILHAEQILVLDDGKLVGKGTHKELLESCPQYREIAESQLRKEELA